MRDERCMIHDAYCMIKNPGIEEGRMKKWFSEGRFSEQRPSILTGIIAFRL